MMMIAQDIVLSVQFIKLDGVAQELGALLELKESRVSRYHLYNLLLTAQKCAPRDEAFCK